ncbi:ubiquitin family protein [Anaeramoeba flamelloides]|uniref:Ubiquitin family protein n=1 Tax=Anaeramoeba flamelloides TaxID=1746091 RepID=A0AAV7YGL6_9EUKA|nr:ubiquitin family protein [Anaeramoeba flamelloides]
MSSKPRYDNGYDHFLKLRLQYLKYVEKLNILGEEKQTFIKENKKIQQEIDNLKNFKKDLQSSLTKIQQFDQQLEKVKKERNEELQKYSQTETWTKDLPIDHHESDNEPEKTNKQPTNNQTTQNNNQMSTQNPDVIKYSQQLEQLGYMGFTDQQKNLDILKQFNGNVDLALDKLFN